MRLAYQQLVMTTEEPSETAEIKSGWPDQEPSKLIDWLVALALAVMGLLIVAIGSVVLVFADRAFLQELLDEAMLRSDVFTDAELVEIAHAIALWGGAGSMIVGAAIILVGIWYIAHRRNHDHQPVTVATVNGLVGAVVTVVTSFIPFSGIIGGGVAGYLQPGTTWAGAKAGALSGVLISLPALAIVVIIALSLLATEAFVFGLLALIITMFALVYAVVLGGLGGYIGRYFAIKNQPTE